MSRGEAGAETCWAPHHVLGLTHGWARPFSSVKGASAAPWATRAIGNGEPSPVPVSGPWRLREAASRSDCGRDGLFPCFWGPRRHRVPGPHAELCAGPETGQRVRAGQAEGVEPAA